MKEKKLTDEEIVKDLERYNDEQTIENALDLIRRLQDENEKLGKVLSTVGLDEYQQAQAVQQTVKDTAKELYKELEEKGYFEYGQFIISGNDFIEIFGKHGVEVE